MQVPDAVRADVVLRSTMTPREAAIAIVEDSRRTHVMWRDWLRAHPDDPAQEGVGDVRWQEECIVNYDLVLEVLREEP